MPGFDVNQIFNAGQAGLNILQRKQQMEQARQEHELEVKRRQIELDATKYAGKERARKEAIELAQLMQGQTAPEMTTGMAPLQQAPLPGLNGEMGEAPAPQAPEGSRQIAMPLKPVNIPGVHGPDAQIQPRSMQDLIRQRNQEKATDLQMQRDANTYTITDPTSGQRITGPQQLIDNFMTQTGQNQRQNDQQEAVAAENEKRLKQESERAVADRLSREQIAAANRAQQAAAAAQSGKATKTVNQAISVSSKFDSNPVVKRFTTIKEASDFASGLDAATKNPGDDQALLYAFAKAMDPDSVVREGEYATVQKYAQSWADNFGFNIQRVYSNSTFLTPEARQNMKNTILAKAKTVEVGYKNIYKETEAKLKAIGEDPGTWLTDYGTVGPATPSQPATLVGPSGAVLTLGPDGRYHAAK